MSKRLRPWWAWTSGLLGLGGVLLLVAGGQLSGASFGTSLRDRACDGSALPGLLLLAVAAFVLSLGFQFVRLRSPDAEVVLDPAALVVTVPVPAAMLAATLPGVLGCALATDIARVGIIGDALVGTSGLMLAAGASALLGVALSCAVSVAWSVARLVEPEEAPGIVELAIAEAEALEADAGSSRFHGVDSGE